MKIKKKIDSLFFDYFNGTLPPRNQQHNLNNEQTAENPPENPEYF
jgi:hypothetical protein